MLLIEEAAEVPLDVDAIVEAAQRLSGSAEMGNARFLEGLQVVVQSFRDVWPQLRPNTQGLIGRSIADILVSRISILGDRTRYPEIANVRIDRPVFFIGMGRTGSTLIQTLMAQDPANISYQLWETIQPSPPPRFGMGDERRSKATRVMKTYIGPRPKLLEQHPYFIDNSYRALAECGNLCEKSFANFQFFAFFATRRHFDWLADTDLSEAIQFHKMFLQHLQWGREGRSWILKAVEHGILLHKLSQVYPDATFVWTHRDPLSQAASLASVLSVVRSHMISETDTALRLGDDALLAIKETINRGMAARRAMGEGRFIDVYFADMMRDPIGTVRELYRKLGRPFNAETELAMEVWLRNNRSDKGGAHSYTPDQFGLDQSRVKRDLAEYLDWFGASIDASLGRRNP